MERKTKIFLLVIFAFLLGVGFLSVKKIQDSKVRDGDGKKIFEQDFTWGVLALNLDQSAYLPDSMANFTMSVLDNKGMMVCDAKVTLSVTDSKNRETVLRSENGEISVSPDCHSKGLTDLPDYSARYKTSGPGVYKLKLTAETASGIKEMDDELRVEDDPPFIVKRQKPTRIYPPSGYAMTLDIEARRNFQGAVIETVPGSFLVKGEEIFKKEKGGEFSAYNSRLVTQRAGAERKLVWQNIDIKSGETLRIKYVFTAPNASPDMHLLGKAELVDSVKTAEIPPAPEPKKEDFGTFEIERNGPVPTDQPGIYQVVTKVKVKEDSQAYLADLLPNYFSVTAKKIFKTTTTERDGKVSVTKQLIRDMDDASPIDAPVNIHSLGEGDIHEIVWQVPWKAGETYDLMFQFDPKDFKASLVNDFLKFTAKDSLDSPINMDQFDFSQFDERDKIEIGNVIYGENRFWQIAADATTSAKYTGTAAESALAACTAAPDTGAGVSWTGYTNVYADDTSYATVSITDNQCSDYIKATNFGFTTSDIPSGSTIDGITANVGRWANTASRLSDDSVKIVKGGTIQGTEMGHSRGTPSWPATVGSNDTYGSATEKWGLTWVDTDIVGNSNFGLAFAAGKPTTSTGSYTGTVDWIRITVDYSPPISAPTITLSAATNKEATTATLNGNVTATGGENPTVTVYWGTSDGGQTPGNWANSSAPTSPGQPQGVAAFYKDVTSLPSGTTIYFSAKATNSAGTSWPAASLSFLTKPAAPTSVAATDGTYTDKVTITWTKSTGATDYHVWRDSTDLGAAGDVATADDSGADAPTVTPGTAAATDGTATDKVTLSISGASANNGTTHTYKVVASNATGNSADSSTNTGYRGVGSLTYQWKKSAADSDASYSDIGGATTDPYDDTGAPAGTITAGTASASDGTSSAYVTLSLSGESANSGAGRYYYATVSATGATSQDTTHNRGYRGVGSLTYQWQRSAADSDASYSDIGGATTDPYDDTGAPSNGDGRYYKCVLNATGAAQQTSSADRGYRSSGSLSVDIVDSGGTPVGSPSVTFGAKTFDWAGQQATGTLGISAEKLRLTNTTGTPTWNLTISATSGPTALWSDGGNTYDFNGNSSAGRLQIDASGSTITPQGGCGTTGLNKGSATYFAQGTQDSITLVSADGSAQTSCYWDITDVGMTQDIPSSQVPSTYTLGLSLTAS